MMPPMLAINTGSQLAAANAGRKLVDIENERLSGQKLTPDVVAHGIRRFFQTYGRIPKPNREDADNLGIFLNEKRPNNALFGADRIKLGMTAMKMHTGSKISLQQDTIDEGSREVGLTANSMRQETEDVIDSLLADAIHYVGSDDKIIHDSSDAIDMSTAAVRGKNPSKAFYYKSLSRAMDNDDISEEGILKAAQKYASNLKGVVDDRIGEVLSKEDMEALSTADSGEMEEWLDMAFGKEDLVLVIIVMAALGIKKKMDKVFVSAD